MISGFQQFNITKKQFLIKNNVRMLVFGQNITLSVFLILFIAKIENGVGMKFSKFVKNLSKLRV